MQKLTKEEFNKLIKTVIAESKSSDDLKELLPSSDKDLVDFATKVDEFLLSFIQEAEELRTEGAELVAKDILGSSKVGERNRFVFARVGLLQKIKNLLIQAHENLKRET